MFIKRTALTVALGTGLMFAPLSGCEDLPGDPETQGAVVGGVAGAAGGALIGGEDNRLLGALIGGAVGAGGGYLIGSQIDKTDADDEDVAEAREAIEEARTDPATPQEVLTADTADLNDDGFVTMDEVIAMDQAGLSDREMLARLEATDQVFELTDTQEQYLINQGVSPYVVSEMQTLNFEQKQEALSRQQAIGRDIGY